MKTKWIVNNGLSCMDKDETCTKDNVVYWKVELDLDDNPIRVISDMEGCKKHLRENGIRGI